MIAVVDGHADGAVEVRAAAPGWISGGLCHHELRVIGVPSRQLHRCGKSGKTCPDNVDGAGHQMIAYCTAIQDRRSGLTEIRVRGGDQPRDVMPLSMTR